MLGLTGLRIVTTSLEVHKYMNWQVKRKFQRPLLSKFFFSVQPDHVDLYCRQHPFRIRLSIIMAYPVSEGITPSHMVPLL